MVVLSIFLNQNAVCVCVCVCVCVRGGGGGSLNLSFLEHSHVGSLFTIEEQKRVGSSHTTVCETHQPCL